MAPFDKDPKVTDTPPVQSPGVSGVFGPAGPIFKQQGDDAGSSAGEFTNLFGKPPKPAPLEGIGTNDLAPSATPAAPAIAGEPAEPVAPSQPGSFTMIFGASPVAPKLDPVSGQPPCEPADGFAKTSVLEAPVKGSGRATSPESEARPGGGLSSLFASPSASANAESREVPPPKPFVAETAPVVPPTAAPAHNPSEFTMMFADPTRPSAAEGAPKPVAESAPPAVLATPPSMLAKTEPKGAPGSFTQLFGTPVDSGSQAPPQPPAAADASPGLKSASPEEFASIFNFPLRDSSSAPEPAPNSAPGEFTAMFNSAPVISSTPPLAVAAKDSGAFTKLFNAPAPNAAAQAPMAQAPSSFDKLFSPADPVKTRKEESFTGIFGGADTVKNDAKRTSSPPGSQGFPASNFEQAPRSEVKQPIAAWSPSTPSSTPASASSSGATQIFTRPGDAPAPASPPPPTGPSAFTQVISGGMVREATQRAAAQAAPPPPSPQFMPPAGYPPMPSAVPPAMPTAPTMPQPASFQPNFGQPPAMNPPGMWPAPPMPQPQMPSMQYPQMPQPQMPQPPLAKPSAPAKTNWLPLIIGVNIFVLIVVILIVVFALRK